MKKAEIPQHIVNTAMSLATEKGWRDLSLAEISASSKVPLSQLYTIFPSKLSIVRYISDGADSQTVDDEDGDRLEQPAKDRLFDLLMSRFDALQPYKQGLTAIAHDCSRDPLTGIAHLCNLRRSMTLILEAAGLSTSGLRGGLRIKVLSVLYLNVFRTWLGDESEDLTKTMSALDKGLERIDIWARRCSNSCAPKKTEQTI
ncbi:hypothetical protein [Kiloniella sp.]|uniref:hypothetical protein n=1 Tax=Kiloniella sp. TaxID=1938587 RepID=UPI003B013424